MGIMNNEESWGEVDRQRSDVDEETGLALVYVM